MQLDFKEILPIVTLGGVLVGIVLALRRPQEMTDKSMVELRKDLDTTFVNISNIHERIGLIERNSLKHIESRLDDLEKGQIRITTILDERLPKKNNN